MRSFDQRFREQADPELIDRLGRLPVGSTVTLRGVVFVKDTRHRWHNAFRALLTTREVASVLTGEFTIAGPP